MKHSLKTIISIPIILMSSFLFSQVAKGKDSVLLVDKYIIFEGDTLLIELNEVLLLKKLKFKTDYSRRYYYWFRKKTIKAYPYAKLAADRLTVLHSRLDSIKSKRKRRQYTKRVQKYMEQELTVQLKKLTRTEGRILIKLVHRQTGDTSFNLIKELRSGWKAFWYNTTASLFKLSLKAEYDPVNNRGDYLIEDILHRAFMDGILEEQSSKLDFDYLELGKKWIDIPKPREKKKS